MRMPPMGDNVQYVRVNDLEALKLLSNNSHFKWLLRKKNTVKSWFASWCKCGIPGSPNTQDQNQNSTLPYSISFIIYLHLHYCWDSAVRLTPMSCWFRCSILSLLFDARDPGNKEADKKRKLKLFIGKHNNTAVMAWFFPCREQLWWKIDDVKIPFNYGPTRVSPSSPSFCWFE